MISIYRPLYQFLRFILIRIKPLLNQKLKEWVELRSFIYRLDDSFHLDSSIWFHAASGEIEYAKAVIQAFKIKNPQTQIVVSYSSPSAEKLFENLRPFVEKFIPICWDEPRSLKKLIRLINPRFLILSRTDLWPEMLEQAHLLKVPIGIISYFPKINFINKIYLKAMLSKLNFISCVDFQTAARVQNLVSKKSVLVAADGDTRFDQVFLRLSQNPKFVLKPQQKIFICGSTWPEDEEHLLPIFSKVLDQNYQIILSPHEVSKNAIDDLKKRLDRRGLTYESLSEQNSHTIHLSKNIFIIDHIGYLADAYRFADVAFVGGSFKSRVHSVMEPLCCGLPVLVGPHFKNSPESIHYLEKYVFSGANSEEIFKNFNKILNHSLHHEILSEMKKNQGATQKIQNHIEVGLQHPVSKDR